MAVWTFGGPLWDSVVVGYRISATPDRLQSRVASVDWPLSMSLAAVGPLVGGYLLSTIGSRDTLLAFAGLVAVFAALGSAPHRFAVRHRQSSTCSRSCYDAPSTVSVRGSRDSTSTPRSVMISVSM